VDPHSQIIVALDCGNRATADDIVDRLGDECRFYKVGLELLTAVGPDFVKDLVAQGKDVFLDLKLFEIPNSVAGAVRPAGALGVSMVTVHSMGGTGIMTADVDAARDFPELRILALTLVTSMTDEDLADIGVSDSAEEQVLRSARLAGKAGCYGVIASPQDVAALRNAMGSDALIVTPGVALAGETPSEHARPGTPRAALDAGASHVVVGRTVTRATDPAAVFRLVRAPRSVIDASRKGAGRGGVWSAPQRMSFSLRMLALRKRGCTIGHRPHGCAVMRMIRWESLAVIPQESAPAHRHPSRR
jgi:orotidine-5'-phosphate decarboxylase